MRDVARFAGVSVATVSAVINEKGVVSEKLMQRVKHAMEALDYHTNHVARSLKVRCTHTIGMVIPDVTNPFFTDVMRGAEDEARTNGYSVILCNSNEDPTLERSQLSTLFSRRVDGVLLAPTDSHSAHDRLTRRRFPIIYFDRIPPGYEGGAVVTNNFGGAYEATRHLIALGHRDIAIVTGRLDMSNGRDRLDGFMRALQEAHISLPQGYLQRGTFQLESGYQCGLELLRLPRPPTAIFCCNNKMTLGLMGALRELGVACPERLSVLGFDDFDWAASFSPRLTTVAQQTCEMGRQAMKMLLDKIQGAKEGAEPGKESVVELKAELRIRESTAPPFRG